METALLSVLSLGFMLGIKHAVEPDHVIAVSTIASQSKKLTRSSLAGVFWGIGHTFTLFLVGMLVILLKVEISIKWAMSLEFLVGVMLVYLGITSILSLKKMKSTTHNHPDIVKEHFHLHPVIPNSNHIHKNSSYWKSMFIGIVHGLAGSAAMLVLTMSTVDTVWQGALYMLIFGLGTIIGMLLTTTLIGIPFVWSANKHSINSRLTVCTGLVSTFFGLYYMYNLGMSEGLFLMWMNF